MSYLKTELIDTEKLTENSLNIYIFIDKEYQQLFNEIIKEYNIQTIKDDTRNDLQDVGCFYTLQFADANAVYWFGRSYEEAINKYHKTV